MNFYVKVSLAVAVLVAAALAFIFLFSSSEEDAIVEVLEGGLEAAERGDADAVAALISPDYRNGEETREGIIRRIRQAVAQRITPARLVGHLIQVSGEDAQANVTVEVGALQFRRQFALALKLRKEGGVWKVTSAEEAGR